MTHLEGIPSVLAALAGRRRMIRLVLLRRDAAPARRAELEQACEAAKVPLKLAEADELDRMAHGRSHGGVIALVSDKPRLDARELSDFLAGVASPLLLMLEGVDDARNLGFTLRTAEAMGAHAVVIKKHLWAFDETEVARSASGAYDRIELAQLEDVNDLKSIRARGVRLLGCLAGVRTSLFDADLRGGVILAIGGEKRGLSGATREACDGFLTIPTKAGASLSLSHAAAIVTAEAFRQRRGDRGESNDGTGGTA